MQTISEVQAIILQETGIKTSVKHGKGSMKDYFIFTTMFQSGSYPDYPHQWRREFKARYPETDPETIFIGSSQIDIHKSVLQGEADKFKTERKPKPIDPNKPQKGWGSKNSQMRLDKAAARHTKKLLSGKNIARYM